LLLIAFKYPPYAGVGSFRWAKLSKYLARLGRQIHVVTVPWRQHGPNALVEDVRHERIVIHEVRSGAPHNLRIRPIENRWLAGARTLARQTVDRTFYFDDEAQRWGRHLLPLCERLIDQHGIEVAVATGHPFQANRWALELKRRVPGLRLVQDFRDPWADNPFRRLSDRQREQVRTWQRDAVEGADAIVTVTEGLRDLYLRDAHQERAVVIPNGVDPETLPSARPPEPRDDLLRITHVGNVFNGRDVPLRALLDATRQRGQRASWRIVLAGAKHHGIAAEYQDLVDAGRLELVPPVAHEDALGLIASSDIALQLGAAEFPYLVSTKIYEHGMLRVPTLSLNYGGEISRLISEHGLGRSVDLRQDDLDAALDDLDDLGRDLAFDVEDFEYPRLAARYSELLDSL
jgi:glycosyltransferase involved in cell wall biosynthesis